MVYALVVAITMFVAPLGAVALALAQGQTDALSLTGKWFVFWAVGVRLGLAGVRQYLQPGFTSRDILKIESPEVFPLVRELGGANIASGVLGLASLWAPSFVTPAALGAAIFYAVAAIEHLKAPHRARNETIALVSDVFVALVLAAFLAGQAARGLT